MELTRRGFLSFLAATASLLYLKPPKKAEAKSAAVNGRKGVLVDTSRCIGCWWCYAACKKDNNLPETIKPEPQNPPALDFNVWTTLKPSVNDRGEWIYAKRQCMHCEHPACVEACIVGALQKSPEGPVTYDENKCIGCRYCMVACPFGIPNFEWEDTNPWIRKCDFCFDRLAEGLEPACVNACTCGALNFGEHSELLAEAKSRINAEPGKYVNHVYGENEAGGTSWLYLSTVPFENHGLPQISSDSMTVNSARAMSLVPPVLMGVAALMTGVYWLTKRKQKLSKQADSDEKTGVVK